MSLAWRLTTQTPSPCHQGEPPEEDPRRGQPWVPREHRRSQSEQHSAGTVKKKPPFTLQTAPSRRHRSVSANQCHFFLFSFSPFLDASSPAQSRPAPSAACREPSETHAAELRSRTPGNSHEVDSPLATFSDLFNAPQTSQANHACTRIHTIIVLL